MKIQKRISLLLVFGMIMVLPLGSYAQGEDSTQNQHREMSSNSYSLSLDTSSYQEVSTTKEEEKLNKVIRLNEKSYRFILILKKIAQQTGLKLSYSEQIIPENKKIVIKNRKVTARKAISKLLKNTNLQYTISNGQLIILKAAEKNSQENVSGTVTDGETGNSLPGANILVKGASTGTTTDSLGHYSVSVSSLQDTLVFSYIGFVKKTIPINGRTTINVKLRPVTISGDQLVVVGYSTQKKADITGSVSSISGEQVKTTKTDNVVNMLSGKIAGLRVQQNSSKPGTFDANYDIRGFGSPLVVIDGVPRNQAALSRLNPNSIKNISVLKDASAAVYGLRAANGVILVTTKEGTKNSGFHIRYSFNYGIQRFPSFPSAVNATQYMVLKNEKKKRSFGQNFITQQKPAFSSADMMPYENGTKQSTNWVGAVVNKQAPRMKHNLSLRGGSSNVTYFFNLGYKQQDGLFKSNSVNYNRYNVRSNVNVDITENLHAKAMISGYKGERKQPNNGTWATIKAAWNNKPTDPVYANNSKSHPAYIQGSGNPVASSNSKYIGYQKYINKDFQGQIDLTYDIPSVKGLSANGLYSYGLQPQDNTTLNKAYDLYQYDSQSQAYKATTLNTPNSIYRYYGKTIHTLFHVKLNYTRTFLGVHDVSGMLLFEREHTNGDNFYAQRNLALGSSIPYLFAGQTTDQVGSMNAGGLYDQANEGLVGRFKYNYDQRYLATFSFRYDGSAEFAPGHRWGFFPAVSLGWRLSNEPFLQNVFPDKIVDNLKIRASYGKLGDDRGTAGFQYVSGYNYPATGYIFGSNYVNGLSSRGAVNRGLTWYTSRTLDIGLDFELWDGLLGGSVDYFERNRKGLLATKLTSLPASVGESLPQQNLNSDRTKGYEIKLTHHNKIGQVGYKISGNMSTTRTMLRVVQQSQAGNEYLNWKNGRADRYTNIVWGKTYEGHFTSYNQIQNYEINTGGGNQNTVVGDYHYKDLNHDGVINSKDEQPIATRNLPNIEFGMTFGASWKGINFTMLLQGATMYYTQYAEQLYAPLEFQKSSLTKFLDRWHTKDPSASNFNPNTQWVPGYFPTTGSTEAQGTRAVHDASYVRIKNLQIGYTLPKNLTTSFGIQKLRIYVNAYNLATFDGLRYNADPEHPGSVNYGVVAGQGPGANFGNNLGGYKYPENKIYNIGASISF